MAADLCLPVLKYSHAVGVRSDNSIPWTHIQAADLFAIVTSGKTPGAESQLNLRVVQGTRVLESIEIAQYIDSALDARHGAEQHGVTPQVDQLPIFGITKESLLALRYRPSDGQARRLQLRMSNVTDCRQVVDAFVRRGMEFREQRPTTARPGSVRPVSSANQERLLTAHSSSPYFQPAQTVLPSTQAIDVGSLPRLPSRSPERSPTRGDLTHEQPAHQMPPPPFLRRDEVAAPREVVPTRPTTAQMYRSYTTPPQPPQHNMPEVLRRPSDPTGERPSSTSHVAMLETIREAAEATPPRPAPEMPQSSLYPSLSDKPWSSGTPESAVLTALLSDPTQGRPQSARPSTAATTVPPENLDHEVPPRRELPFKRPGSSRSGQASSRSGTSAVTLPPLPKPNLAKTSSESPKRADSMSPEKQALGSRPGTASTLKRAYNADDDDHSMQQTAISSASDTLASTDRETSPTKQARTIDRTSSPDSVARKLARLEELLNARKPLSNRSTNVAVPRMDSLADAPHETLSPPTSPPKAVAARGGNASTVNAFKAVTTQARDAGVCTLEEYATQSLQDRQAVLEEFMIANLENPAFTKLCEDVENCWRRIALGL